MLWFRWFIHNQTSICSQIRVWWAGAPNWVISQFQASGLFICSMEQRTHKCSGTPSSLVSSKTVFLIALASSRRRNEIYALSASSGSVNFSADNCIFFPGFLAKNQVPSVPRIPLEIPSLSRDKSRSGTLLCPVRALCFYMRRTRSFRRKKKRLFISFVKNYDKEISPSTISRWIVDCCVYCSLCL